MQEFPRLYFCEDRGLLYIFGQGDAFQTQIGAPGDREMGVVNVEVLRRLGQSDLQGWELLGRWWRGAGVGGRKRNTGAGIHSASSFPVAVGQGYQRGGSLVHSSPVSIFTLSL
jgi:hypothetical protein